MKKNLLKFGTLLLVSVMIACSGGDGPKAVAEKFLKESQAENWDAAKKLSTEETGKLLDMMAGFAKMGDKDKKKKEDKKFTMGDEKIDGDNATVTYKEEGKDANQTMKLKKVDGKWLVSVSKDDMSHKDSGSGKGSDAGSGTDNTPPPSNDMPVDSGSKK